MNFIKKLQNRPRYVRIQILWISVVLVMVIIFSLWTVYLKLSLRASESEQKLQAQTEGQSIPSLFDTLKEDFSILKNNLQAGVGNLIGGSKEDSRLEVEIIKP